MACYPGRVAGANYSVERSQVTTAGSGIPGGHARGHLLRGERVAGSGTARAREETGLRG